MTDTQSDGEYLAGTTGDDTLGSTHNMTTLDGLPGADTLTSTLTYVTLDDNSVGVASLTQIGGTGADSLDAAFLGADDFMDDLSLSIELNGGEGDDTLQAQAAPGFELYASTATANILIDAGEDDDDITATLGYANLPSSWTSTVKVDAGTGDDTIVLKEILDSYASYALMEIYAELAGGDGNDSIFVDLSDRTSDEMIRTLQIYGGDGDDTIDLDYTFEAHTTTTDTNMISGGAGDDVITVNLLADNIVGAASYDQMIKGGIGEDTIIVNFTEIFGGVAADTLAADVKGGGNHDTITFTSDVKAQSLSLVAAGGNGRDTITTDVDLTSFMFTPANLSQDLSGGDGSDTFNLTASVTGDNVVTAGGTIAGNDGHDTLTSATTASTSDVGAVINQTFLGGAGSDVIDVTQVASSAMIFGTAVSGVVIDGGTQNDTITTDIRATSADFAGTQQTVLGGYGHDIMDLRVNSISSGASTNSVSNVDGGRGNDDITVVTLAQNNMNSSGIGTAEHTVFGSGGGDTIITEISGFGESAGYTTEIVDGGRGEDKILVETDTTGRSSAVAEYAILGDEGNDVIQANTRIESTFMQLGQAATYIEGNYVIDGGLGNDEIAAVLESVTPTDLTAIQNGQATADVTLTVLGGEGNDGISVGIEGLAGADIDGGLGDDTIKIDGGWDNIGGTEIDNVMNGGSGNDELYAGNANDRLSGGLGADRLVAGDGTDGVEFWAGDLFPALLNSDPIDGFDADTFVFKHEVDQGEVHITDWQRELDILDLGTTFKEDLLGFLVVDQGQDEDVIVTMTGGTDITFEKAGTGLITTVYDLVDDPLTQIV